MMIAPADRLQRISEYYFSKKLEEIRHMRARGIDVINLGIGSPDLIPASEVIEGATQALKSGKSHGYAPYKSTPELRTAISQWYEESYKVVLDPETQVLPLLGSKEGILYTSLAFLNPGDEVLVPNPGYPAYTSVSHLVGATMRTYELRESSSWEPDLKALEATDLSRVKLMWVNYPHMPSGAAGSETLFERLVAFGKHHRILICNDNPYGLVLNDSPPRSLLKFDPGFEGVLELNSLSKSFNMAGWRVGMVLGHAQVIQAILQVKSNVDSGMFLPIQSGAISALKLPPSWHVERNAIYKKRRNLAYKIFDSLGFRYSKNQVGLFVWAKAPDSVTQVEELVDKLLDDAHVFLTPGSIFGSMGSRYARISLCASLESFESALKSVERQSKVGAPPA